MHKFTIKQKNKNLSICIKPISDRQRFQLDCPCDLCSGYYNRRMKELTDQSQRVIQAQLNHKIIHHYSQSHLQKMLRHLIIPPNKIVRRGIELFIPEICFFQDGEPVQFYYTKDVEDYHLIKLKKQKITTTLMQKVFNQRKRDYRQKIKKVLNVVQEKRELSYTNRSSKNAQKKSSDNLNCNVIRFIDGCETIITQLQLLFILQKRKQDPFWKQIQYIKNYIHPYYAHDQSVNSMFISYTAQNPLFKDLHSRAFLLMDNYAEKVMPSQDKYISDQHQTTFLHDLLSESKQAYLTYNLYKIVAFIETFADQKIIECKCKMMVNELKNCYLLEVLSLTTKPLVKYDWTHQKFKQMINQQENEKYYRQNLTITPETKVRSQLIERLMREQYQQMKIKRGISVAIQQDENERLNAQFFRFMHPNIQKDLHVILRQNIPFKQFKKKYLGKTQQRRRLFKPFDSKFVRQLHKLTPIKTLYPKQPGSTIHSDIKSNQKHDKTWRTRNPSHYWRTLQL